MSLSTTDIIHEGNEEIETRNFSGSIPLHNQTRMLLQFAQPSDLRKSTSNLLVCFTFRYLVPP